MSELKPPLRVVVPDNSENADDQTRYPFVVDADGNWIDVEGDEETLAELVRRANLFEEMVLPFLRIIAMPQGCITGRYSLQAEKILHEFDHRGDPRADCLLCAKEAEDALLRESEAPDAE